MQNVSIRQLRSLVAIHETGKISSAARLLRLTAPAVTLQLKQLEEELGQSLFDRTSTGLRPTAAGSVAIEAARSIVDRLRLLSDEIGALEDVRSGTLKLGVVSTARYFAPRLIAGFLKEYPGVRIGLRVGNRAQTISSLTGHELDLALMGRPPRDLPVRSAVFGDHPLVIVAPPGHRLAGRIDIPKEEVAREEFLVREPGSGTRISLERYFSDVPGWGDTPATQMDSNETIKQAVMAGLGIAFLSAHTIEQELQFRRLVILDVAGMPIRRQWFAVSRLDRSTSPSMKAFADFLARNGPRYLPVIPKTYPADAAASYPPAGEG